MNVAAGLALLLGAVLFQLTWVPHLAVFGLEPNPALLIVAAWTWLRGGRAGVAWALAAGLLLDLGSSGPPGIHAIALLAATYSVGAIRARLDEGRVVVPAAAAAVASIIYGLIVIAGGQIFGQSLPSPAVARVLLLGGGVYNALAMPLFLLALRRVERLLGSQAADPW